MQDVLDAEIVTFAQGEVPDALLDLSHPVFARRMSVAYTFSPVRAAPARQFDAYVVFPEITVLDSIRRAW